MTEEEKKINEDSELFKDLIVEEEDNEEDEAKKNAQTQQQKDAEEARKRREAELKEAKDAGFENVDAYKAHQKSEKERLQKEADEKAKKEEADKKAKEEEEKNNKEKTPQEKLGAELVDFKTKYPNIDLEQLEKDNGFKKFAKGKLLGSQNFTQIYEEFVDFVKEQSGKSEEDIKKNHQIKAGASSGSSTSTATIVPQDVYSEDELEKITRRLPFMNEAEAEKVLAKVNKSVAFYKNKK